MIKHVQKQEILFKGFTSFLFVHRTMQDLISDTSYWLILLKIQDFLNAREQIWLKIFKTSGIIFQ